MSPKPFVPAPLPADPSATPSTARTAPGAAARARRRAVGQLGATLASVASAAATAPVRSVSTTAAMMTALGLGLRPAPLRAQLPGKVPTASSKADKAAAAAPALGARPEVQAFLDEIATRNDLDRADLGKLFGRVQRLDRVLDLMNAPSRPGARRIWSEYRGRFVDDFRINEGVRFWQRNATAVTLAGERSGVPEAIIVAIIGVETVYGRQTGDFRVVETLSTLGFDYEPRAPYFRGELEQFLLYARENKVDPMQPRGSYAGAMGLPQFMPTSLRRWAVDLDGDGRIDLMNSAPDALGSVGNFLKAHGWAPGKATHYAASIEDPGSIADLVAAGPKPSFTIEQLHTRGVLATEEVPVTEMLVLVDLPEGDNPTHYVLGTENFYAITRYNRSYFYAMAVIELANALKKAR